MDKFPVVEKKIEEPRFDSEFFKSVFSEVEQVKVKLANAHSELKIKDKEYELKMEQMKNSFEKRLADLSRKHKYEIEKLINVLTGCADDTKSIINFSDGSLFEGESIFDDPIRMRLLIETREKIKTVKLSLTD